MKKTIMQTLRNTCNKTNGKKLVKSVNTLIEMATINIWYI